MTNLIYDVSMHEDNADYVVEILRKSGLSAIKKESRPYNDIILGEIDSIQRFEVLLPAPDFEKADLILKAELQKNQQMQYLQDVSEDVLMEIVQQSAHQNRLHFLTAQYVLLQRGVVLPEVDKKEEAGDNSRHLSNTSKMLLIVVSLTGFGFILPGIGGIILGLFFRFFKLHNQKGELFPAFDGDARNFGIFLSLLSLIMITSGLFFFS